MELPNVGERKDLFFVDDPFSQVPPLSEDRIDALTNVWKMATRMFPKAGPTNRRKRLTRQAQRAKNDRARRSQRRSEKLRAQKAKLEDGRFFYRYLRSPGVVAEMKAARYNNYGQVTALNMMVEPMVKIAKILDDELWLRHNHKSVEEKQEEWSKAKNAKPTRLNQEILQVGAYMENDEIEMEWAEELLDLLYMHLGQALR